MRRWPTLFLLQILFFHCTHVIAETRIALVIGNGAYGSNPLSDPPNDAKLIAKTLRSLDFEVTEQTNRDERSMRRLIRNFAKKLKAESAAVGLFYYSGHGIQVGGRNYMIPIDAEILDEVDVESAGVGLDEVLSRMDIAGNALNIVILDACRNNPYEKSYKSTGDGGLAKIPDIPKGSIIAFAAEAHKVALQGEGKYSVFTEVLARELSNPGVDIGNLFTRVRIEVNEKTNGKQVPTVQNQLLVEEFILRATSDSSQPVVAPIKVNDIIDLQVLSERNDHSVVRIDYYYSGNWGNAGWLSAEAIIAREPDRNFTYYDTQGCAPNNTAKVGHNSTCMRLVVPEGMQNIQFRTDAIEACLFSGTSSEKHCETFPYIREWN